ncbi:hypothetical protein N9O61_02540 [Octadecabacter sp.]|nr:hypothetical protein [Octadecabacter sp.]
MKRTVFTFAAGLMMATSANAGGIVFDLPNLEFPAPETVTVAKDCVLPDAQSGLCTADR